MQSNKIKQLFTSGVSYLATCLMWVRLCVQMIQIPFQKFEIFPFPKKLDITAKNVNYNVLHHYLLLANQWL